MCNKHDLRLLFNFMVAFVTYSFVPAGQFVIQGNLTIPPGVTLFGTFGSVPSHDLGDSPENPQSMLDGSILIPTGGHGCWSLKLMNIMIY
eukprot:m.86075 g.86075  ORF g.86075 m.86075 type:complete len:90 (+) comp13043_c0_seq2:242-511(+)